MFKLYSEFEDSCAMTLCCVTDLIVFVSDFLVAFVSQCNGWRERGSNI